MRAEQSQYFSEYVHITLGSHVYITWTHKVQKSFAHSQRLEYEIKWKTQSKIRPKIIFKSLRKQNKTCHKVHEFKHKSEKKLISHKSKVHFAIDYRCRVNGPISCYYVRCIPERDVASARRGRDTRLQCDPSLARSPTNTARIWGSLLAAAPPSGTPLGS